MFTIKVIDKFSAAHRLEGYAGNCERMHGHNYKVEVCIQSLKLDSMGLVMDFRDIKQALKGAIKDMDHQYLNDLPLFKTKNPSAENIAETIYKKLAKTIPKKVTLSSVAVWENDECCAIYGKK
jgi:6-pyruvoyltetrahydropterin/6-carboxytetrahydropterin synthase